MTRIPLSDADVFRLNCEGCNANEIAAAMEIAEDEAAVLIERARLLHGGWRQ